MDIGAELKGKVGPFPLYVWLLGMSALGLGFYLFTKKKNAAPTTGTPGTPCTQSDGSAGTWDSTGTVCQASTVSTVNAPTNQGRGWRSQSSTATATTGPAATAAASTPPATAATTPPAQTPITPTTTGAAGALSNLQAYNVTRTGATVKWNPDQNNRGGYSYSVMVAKNWPKGPAVRSGVTAGTSVTITGLKPGTTYNFGVQGLPGGAGDNIHFTTAK